MSRQWPGVALLVTNWNGGEGLLRCIESLLGLDYPHKEIVVIDNASTDGSPELVESHFPQVRLLRNQENLGFDAALNRGIRETQAPLLAFVNDDATLREDWLRVTVSALLEEERAALAGGPIWFSDLPGVLWGCGGKVDLLTGLAWDVGKGSRQVPDEGDVDYLQASALLAKREAMEEVGLWDSEYFLYFEDTDIGCRLRSRGYRLLLLRDAVASQAGLGSHMRRLPRRKLYLYVRSNLRFILKSFPWRHKAVAVPLSLLFFLLFVAYVVRKPSYLAEVVRAVLWNLEHLTQTLRYAPLPPGVLRIRFQELLREVRRRGETSFLLPY